VELALRAAQEVGWGGLAELSTDVPLVLPADRGVAIQVVVGEPDASGRRRVTVYSRREDAAEPAGERAWARHSDGYLTAAPVAAVVGDAETVAEVALTPELAGEADRFGLHPALFDAAIAAIAAVDGDPGPDGQLVLPARWRDVTLHSVGATAVRVHASRSGSGELSLTLTDGAGQPVLSVGSLVHEPVPADRLGGDVEPLYGIEWTPLAVGPAPAAGLEWAKWDALPDTGPVPRVVVLDCAALDGGTPDVVARTHELTHRVLGVVQAWLTAPRFADAHLVVVTRNAVATADGSATVDGAHLDVAQAPVWGLVRSAQAENPGRFVLLDTDGTDGSERVLAAAVASAEPELAVRAGEVFVPRLTRIAPDPARRTGFDPDGAVLITGGTGGLGAVVAKYLVTERGVRHLVLASRRGADAAAAAGLADELGALGAGVRIVSCDVSDRDAVAALVAGIVAERPLTGVLHAAGIVDNGLIGVQSPQRVDAVLAPKADAAWYLHEATRELDLAAFVLFSSVGGLVLTAGQGNYAAASTFLDALAAHRRSLGRAATSMAFPLWDVAGGLGRFTRVVDRKRMAVQGVPVVGHEEGLRGFAAALDVDRALVAPIRVDTAALRARTDEVPALLRGLTPARRRAAAGGAGLVGAGGAAPVGAAALRDRLRELGPARQEEVLLDLVRKLSAHLLGHPDPAAVDPERTFLESGFDSLIGVELRNRLGEATGLHLSATVVFDSGNPVGLARWLRGELAAASGADPAASGGAGVPENDSLEKLFLGALSAGRIKEAQAVLGAVARLRPTFESTAELEDLPLPVTLAEGPARPRLICVSGPPANAGAHQYASLAAHFRGLRDVVALPLVGFAAGESLPATPQAATRAIAESAIRASDGEPFVVLGQSAAGSLAYAVASVLENTWGIRPAGVITLDTLSLRHDDRDGVDYGDLMRLNFADMDSSPVRLTNSRLSAMGRWMGVLSKLDVPPPAAPVCEIQCTRAVADAAGAAGAAPARGHAPVFPGAEVRLVDADHVSLAREDAAKTAALIEAWLSAVAQPH
jgi:polyene macrolide polyketide synthase